ncbi:MAG: hypothetical protein WC596_02620 [Candidatus Shapirobacteria bacterium]
MQNRFFKLAKFFWVSTMIVVGGFLVVGWSVLWLGQRPKSKMIVRGLGGSGEVIAEAKIETGQEKEVAVEVVSDDARPEIIRKYLERYKSPLLPYSDLIFELSKTYGFEYYWIVAIGQQESNLCKKIPEDSFNCWGYGIHSRGTLRFESYEMALKSFAEYLKTQYFDKGLNTPELIMRKYCPSSNGSWAHGVQQFIDEMESGDF